MIGVASGTAANRTDKKPCPCVDDALGGETDGNEQGSKTGDTHTAVSVKGTHWAEDSDASPLSDVVCVSAC